jgi:hypothetical protein
LEVKVSSILPQVVYKDKGNKGIGRKALASCHGLITSAVR